MSSNKELCPHDQTKACLWEQERQELKYDITGIKDSIVKIEKALAVSSERFRGQESMAEAMRSQEEQIKALTLSVATLAQTVGVLRTIVFGGVGFTLFAVLGSLLALVLTKGVS